MGAVHPDIWTGALEMAYFFEAKYLLLTESSGWLLWRPSHGNICWRWILWLWQRCYDSVEPLSWVKFYDYYDIWRKPFAYSNTCSDGKRIQWTFDACGSIPMPT
jgi:hypothetical protein